MSLYSTIIIVFSVCICIPHICTCVYVFITYTHVHVHLYSATGKRQGVTAASPSYATAAAAAHSNQCPPSRCLLDLLHCVYTCTLFLILLLCDSCHGMILLQAHPTQCRPQPLHHLLHHLQLHTPHSVIVCMYVHVLSMCDTVYISF